MRFRELNLIAFGHFTDYSLSFSKDPAFHLIYGHNEAGKSTALRAVHDLLYGVPQLSADTFLHAGPELRIGGLLESDSGAQLRIVRRKGRKNTLLDPEGQPLDEETVLKPILGDVDETLFKSMFGLDHDALRRGARDLLSGDGDLSESLFGASVGSGEAHRLLKSLREQAEELFTSRGRGRKRINQEIQAVRDAQKLVARHSTSAQSYHEREQNLIRASEEVERVKLERARLKAERSRCDRLLSVLPLVAKRGAAVEARRQLGTLPDLPLEVETWRIEAVRALEEAERNAAFSQSEILRLEELLSELDVPEALLDLEVQGVEELSQRLGQFRKARIDLPKRQAEQRRLQQEAFDLLRSLDQDLPLSEAESLRLGKPEEQRARRLCAEKVRLDATLLERELSAKESQRTCAQRKRELDAAGNPKDASRLRTALEHVRSQGDLNERLERERRHAAELEQTTADRLRALGRFKDATNLKPEDLRTLAFPSRQTLSRFEREAAELSRRRERAERHASELEQKATAFARELSALDHEGEVPSAAQLDELRRTRDETLETLRRAARKNALEDQRQLSDALDTLFDRMHTADLYADRLRSEAVRVSKRATLLASLETTRRERNQNEDELQSIRGEQERHDDAWTSLWDSVGVDPLPAREMADWLSRVDELLKSVATLTESREALKQLEARQAQLEKELADAMDHLAEARRTLFESFHDFVSRCQETLRNLDAQRQQARDLGHRFSVAAEEDAETERRLNELKEAQKQFRAEWSRSLKQLGLSKDASADEVIDVLDRRVELFHKLKESDDLERRIRGILRDEEQLTTDVRRLVSHVADDLQNLPVGEAAEQLLRRYKKASVDAREQVRLKLELERHQAELRKAESQQELARERLSELVRLSRVNTPDELSEVERKVREARALESERSELEREILSHGEGSNLDEVLAEVAGVRAEDLRQKSSKIEIELGVLDERLEALVQQRTTAEGQLNELGSGAFSAAEELAQRTAELKSSTRRYLRLRLAAAILEREVERYREEHQGPVLRRASELFPQLTLGAYIGLKAGFDRDDQQVILCVAKDHSEKHVDTLSDGARDQLYLSLRLSTIEHYMDLSGRMPLVLDDILIHFDDDRARAALSVLGEVARRTQVLFFTHHRRLVELARQAIGDDALEICSLSPDVALPS